ncbi:RCC1 domain-containing protein [Streptomyces sp. NBC_01210]|uniref:RCC1 domain-containing protein n=1 Tax=Streptomyces sp. NBC_01210 TaxID=2903774 RepID=UPI002E142903|nr:RCC1 domain-containing protein [Streptomyces sp. NBC_01210]
MTAPPPTPHIRHRPRVTRVRAWGNDELGQLGDGTVTDRRAPVTVTGLTGVRAVWTGGGHSIAV